MESVEVNQTWAETLRDASQLGQAVAAVNAPGNDVFASRQVEAEAQAMRNALARFDENHLALRTRLNQEAGPEWVAKFERDMDGIRRATLAMPDEAESLFNAFRADRLAEAGNLMARMDRHYEEANKELFRLREHIGKLQKELFRSQTAAASGLQKFEYGIAGLILLMVCGATYYGYQTAKQEETETKERADAQKRRHELETRTRVLNHVMAAQEEERRRIARDLHDEIGQCLTSLLIGSKTVDAAETIAEARSRNQEIRRIALLTLEEVKRMARGLRPNVLDDLGLAPAIERFAEDFTQTHDIAVDVLITGFDSARLPEGIETALYRIVQEALTNIAKYASARMVTIQIERQPEQIRMQVTDDGNGFDSQSGLSDGGLGIAGMRERVALLDGFITVDSAPGAGTNITVRLPLEGLENAENTCAHR